MTEQRGGGNTSPTRLRKTRVEIEQTEIGVVSFEDPASFPRGLNPPGFFLSFFKKGLFVLCLPPLPRNLLHVSAF